MAFFEGCGLDLIKLSGFWRGKRSEKAALLDCFQGVGKFPSGLGFYNCGLEL